MGKYLQCGSWNSPTFVNISKEILLTKYKCSGTSVVLQENESETGGKLKKHTRYKCPGSLPGFPSSTTTITMNKLADRERENITVLYYYNVWKNECAVLFLI